MAMRSVVTIKSEGGRPQAFREAAMFAFPDGRAFFLKPDLAPYAVDLARSVKASIRRVEVPAEQRLGGLRRLAESLANPDYRTPEVRFRDKGQFHAEVARLTRAQVLARSKEVRDHIRAELRAGRGVSLTTLCDRFASRGYSRPSLKHHLASVRSELAAAGGEVYKAGQEYFLKGKER